MSTYPKLNKGYWICDACAKERGGVWPEGHVATLADVPCRYCDDKHRKPGERIAPWVDFDWPEDEAANRQARIVRD